MQTFLFILTNNIIPVFILILLGYLLGRKFNLDMTPLIKLNFYIFVPAYILFNLYTADIPAEMGMALLFGIGMIILNFLAGSAAARIMRYEAPMRSAFVNAVTFYNSGNYGLPVIILVFSSAPYVVGGATPYLDLAVTAQVAILVLQNVSVNSIGLINAGKANHGRKALIKNIFSIPIIYMIPLTVILRMLPFDFTKSFLWTPLTYSKNALIAAALLTLGIQMSKTKISLKNKDVYLAAAMRLILAPVLAFALIRLMGFGGIIAQTLMISSSVPTAVNTALIAIEYRNHPDFSSQEVMLSTLLSAVTVSAVIYAARVLFPVI